MNKEKLKEIDSLKERIKKLETSKEEPLQVEIVQKKMDWLKLYKDRQT